MMMGPAPALDSGLNTRRVIAFIVAVVAYGVIMWGFNAGLSDIISKKILGNIQTVDIQPQKEDEEKPPPPPPKLDVTPPPFVPPPDIMIEAPPVENTTAIQVVTQQKPVEAPPPAPVRKAVVVDPKPDTRHGGVTKPPFPLKERSAGHTGTVYVQVLILENGRVGDAKVQKSSGYPALDDSAVEEAKRNWRFLPGTEDGKAVQRWVVIPIVFKLE